jgi:spore coat protein U-like protein
MRRAAVTAVRATAAMAMLLWAVSDAAAAGKCTVSTTSINFGSYDVYDTAPNDSTGSIILNCSGGAKDVVVEIDRGGASSFGSRRMVNGSEHLAYNLYLNASRTIVWGDGTGGTQANDVGNPPNNDDVILTVFARIPAGQDVSSGSYSDNVTVTVNH